MRLDRAFFVFVLFPFLISGCAGNNISKKYVLDESKETGVMVVSLTRSGVGAYRMVVDLRSIENDFETNVIVNDIQAAMDWRCPIIGGIPDDKPCGRLARVELPKGEYEFYSWRGSSPATKYGPGIKVKPVSEFSKRFKIIPGKAVYLGNIHFRIYGNRFNMIVNDMRERDLKILYKKNPKITPENVVFQIIH